MLLATEEAYMVCKGHAPGAEEILMATGRRKFLAMLALGGPAATLRHNLPSLAKDANQTAGIDSLRQDLVSGVEGHLWDALSTKGTSLQIARRSPSECPEGKIRWAIEVEEPDSRSNTILGKHPRVLLAFSKSMQVLYGTSLEQAGCMVKYASDSDAAMRLYRENGPYDLVLTNIFQFRELSKRIRERNPEQAIAIVGTCSGTTVRFSHKVPVVRDGFGQQKLIRLVESAIQPRVRILMVMANPNADLHYERFGGPKLEGPQIEGYGQMWHLVTSIPETFEVELETNGNDALARYCARGPYDMVLAELRLPGLAGSDLAAAIRLENPAQRIVMITDSVSVGRNVRRALGDIPVLNLRRPRTTAAIKRARTMGRYEDGEGEALLAWVEAGTALQMKQKKAAKKFRTINGNPRAQI